MKMCGKLDVTPEYTALEKFNDIIEVSTTDEEKKRAISMLMLEIINACESLDIDHIELIEEMTQEYNGYFIGDCSSVQH